MIEISNQTHISNLHPVSFCFESLNSSCPKFYTYPLLIRISLYTFFGTLSALTILGNLLVIITVLHFKQLHTPTNYLILSLAMADLLVGALIMPFFTLQSVEFCWYTGYLHCRIYVSLGAMLCNTSILHLSFIAIDRYFAVCHPLSYQTTITPSVTALMIFYSWSVAAIVAFCVSFLTVQNMDTENSPFSIQCEGACFMFHDKLSATLSPILEFYVPGVIMICIYAKIYHIAKRHARLIQDKHKIIVKMPVDAKATDRKATRTLAIVMGVFLSSWLPFTICNLLDPFLAYSIPPILLEVFAWLACLNSMCNPIVYALFYSWFRKAFKIVLCGDTNVPGVNLSSD